MDSGNGFVGWALPRIGGVWRALGIAIVGCVLAGVLWTASPASAASRRWTVRNEAGHPHYYLTLESVRPWKDNPMAFEGRAEDGSHLFSGGADHFELKYGANYQAVLKYRVGHTGIYVEYWIHNALDFADTRCRFERGKETDGWAVTDHMDVDHPLLRLYCFALPFQRTLYFTDSLNFPPPPR